MARLIPAYLARARTPRPRRGRAAATTPTVAIDTSDDAVLAVEATADTGISAGHRGVRSRRPATSPAPDTTPDREGES